MDPDDPRQSKISTQSLYNKPQWTNSVELTMSCVAMSVGLGNFWRFPYICYENGGGAFLIPYGIVLLFLGRPMYYLDMAMGQFCGRASIYMYLKLSPGWFGIGITQSICLISIISYYAFILAVAGFYLANCFSSELPWEICRPEWGEGCVVRNAKGTRNLSVKAKSSAQFYLDEVVLSTPESIDDGLGTPNWKLCVSLAVVWLLAFCNIMIGIKGYGKVAYFLALFPYAVLICLLVNTCLMTGAWDGILFLLTPTWSKLIAPSTWLNAVTQCFFSLNIGSGTIAMYSSYSNIHQNINLISMIIAVVDTFTSLLCSLTVFAGIGQLAYRIKLPIEDVYEGDTLALGFVSYPDAISTFEYVPYVFAVVFFFMLVVLGLGSLCAYMQVITTNLLEVTNMKVWQASLIVTLFGYLSGIVYTTPGGFGIVTLVDLFGNVYNLTIIAFLQVIITVYLYGLNKWCWNIEFMLGKRVNWYWRFTWAISCPIVLICVCISAIVANEPPLYHGKPYPITALISAYLLLVVIVLPIPLVLIVLTIMYCKLFKGFKEGWKETFTTEHWLPDNIEEAAEIKAFNRRKRASYRYEHLPPIAKTLLAIFKKC